MVRLVLLSILLGGIYVLMVFVCVSSCAKYDSMWFVWCLCIILCIVLVISTVFVCVSSGIK